MFSSEQLVELSSNLKSVIAPICRQHNLSFAQFLIISNIPSAGISLKQLSMVVGTEISTMSRNIDKLLLAGLVVKNPGLLDRRQILITCTPKAVSLKGDLYKKIQDLITKLNFEFLEDDKLISVENVKGNQNGITKVKAIIEFFPNGGFINSSKYFIDGSWVNGHTITYYEASDSKVIFK